MMNTQIKHHANFKTFLQILYGAKNIDLTKCRDKQLFAEANYCRILTVTNQADAGHTHIPLIWQLKLLLYPSMGRSHS